MCGVVLAVLCGAWPLAAQNSNPASPKDLVAGLLDLRSQADLANQAVERLQTTDDRLDWIKALKIQFKVFEATSSESEASLGFEYDFSKAVVDSRLSEDENSAIVSFSLNAKGNVAFDAEKNPADFLQSTGSFHLWQYIGQTVEDPVDENGLTLSSRTFRELAQDQYKDLTGDEIRALPVWQDYARSAFDNDPCELFYDLTLSGGLESNQKFTKKNLAYGAEAHVRYRAWKSDSVLSRFNVLDWPFALIRTLSGEKWTPRGRYLPGLMVGIDQVDPKSDVDRQAVDPNLKTYARIKMELGFRTKVIEIGGRATWFNAGYRVFRELDASTAVKAADMDEFSYFAASLDLSGKYRITYTTGKLPFDLQDQSVWSLGYTLEY